MTETIIMNRIREKFSRAAAHYEKLTGLQQAVGLKLLKEINVKEASRILDVGMGTGWVTEQLCRAYPSAKIIGIDFALGMLQLAQKKKCRFKTVAADARRIPFQDATHDTVISNLAYQWVEDLSLAFSEVYRVLKSGGGFFFSTFGNKTLEELFFAIRNVFSDEKIGNFCYYPLASRGKIVETLSYHQFDDIYVSSELIRVSFKDVKTLLRWLKSIGANASRQDMFLGKESLEKIDQCYREHFSRKGQIFATFETLWLSARK